MKRTISLAMLCGICAALALPPFFYLPLAIIAFCGLYFLLSKSQNLKQSFWIGWSFGFAHHVVGLYWISNALLTDPERFAWMIPFAISLIPAALAIYIGLVAMLHKKLTQHFFNSFSIILFAVLWVIGEYLRAHLFTGFPWNLIGYTLNITDTTMQAASLIGIYGLSFLVVLAATFPILLVSCRQRSASTTGHKKKDVDPGLRRDDIVGVIVFSLVMPLVLVSFGIHRLNNASSENTTTELRLVQANISQDHKWNENLRLKGLLDHLTLSQHASKGRIIIWPETAIPYFLHDNPKIQAMVNRYIRPDHTLISGTLRLRPTHGDDFDLWNSLEVVREGKIISFYKKSRLVPFGEYVPLRNILPFVQKITHGGQDFMRGDGVTTLQVTNLPPFTPLICYEVIYPEYRTEAGKSDWLLNITNDAWFGLSSGPHQHFEMARMRAVEQGLPVVRAANTGISGIIDPYGRIRTQLELGKRGVVEGFLPKPLSERTFYTRHGDWISSVFMLCLLTIVYALVRIKKVTNLG